MCHSHEAAYRQCIRLLRIWCAFRLWLGFQTADRQKTHEMGMEKVLFSGLLFVLAVGFIQAEDECKITELQTIDNCLQGFNTTTVSLVNKECTLNADMCRVAVNVGKCLNDATLGDTCRAFLPTYIHQQLRLAQLRCTLSQIAKQCPNSKVKTGKYTEMC
ncbi:uncharacterized protein LOC121387269 [Gigantopelta aegis]|uniref:uncharacterized protein LOC121387269 n=1 Tax=Gigantopelta aegis TaxID=1735272 RepID=UPI001B8885BE|nr:uncharacterized protein LOC121387269 [Gigantopelta aegis]